MNTKREREQQQEQEHDVDPKASHHHSLFPAPVGQFQLSVTIRRFLLQTCRRWLANPWYWNGAAIRFEVVSCLPENDFQGLVISTLDIAR